MPSSSLFKGLAIGPNLPRLIVLNSIASGGGSSSLAAFFVVTHAIGIGNLERRRFPEIHLIKRIFFCLKLIEERRLEKGMQGGGREGGRTVAYVPSLFDEDKTVKTSITSLQGEGPLIVSFFEFFLSFLVLLNEIPNILRHGVTNPLQRFPFSSERFWIRLRWPRTLGVPIIGSVLKTVRIVVNESRCLRVLFPRRKGAQVFSKKGCDE